MPGWTLEPTTGKPVYQNDDGTVRLTKFDGTVQDVHPDQVSALLGDAMSGFAPSSADDINKQSAQKQWDEASLGTKADFYAREGVKGVIDGATALPRAVGVGAKALATQINPEVANVENPLEALSGENLVEKLDSVVASPEEARREAEQARTFSEVAPLGKTAANLAGFVGGGAALKGLGAVGEALAGTELLGAGSKVTRIGSMAAQGATQAYAAGAEEAWVKDQEYTADAALANMGMGAVFGGGLGVAGEGVRAVANGGRAALAEKLFGGRFSKEAGQAAEEMAQDVTGVKPPEGFSRYFKDTLDAVRDKLEGAQSALSGIPKEQIQKYGGLRWTEEAISAREAFANRQPILDAVTNDLTESLQKMYTESRPIMDEVSRATGKKAANISPLLTGNVDDMMNAARAKASSIEEALTRLDEEAAGDGVKSVLGSGEQVADLRDAMEGVVKKVGAAEDPAAAVNALDEFKARMQRVKKNAATTSRNASSGRQIEQARERAAFAEQVSNDMQSYLEDSSIWGKFGEVQTRVNKAYSRMLDSDKYMSAHLLERTGDDWGLPRYVVDPNKVKGYVEGLGTAKTKILDGLVRDNLAARRDLAEAIVQGYGLGAHEAGMQTVLDSVKSSQGLLLKATDTVGKANIIDQMFQHAGSSHGEGLGMTGLGAILGHGPGALIGKAIDVIGRPDKLMRQAVALREMGLKWQNGVSADIKQAFLAGGEQAASAVGKVGGVAKTAATRMIVSHEERGAQYERAAKNVAEAVADPVALAQKIGPAVGDVAPAAVRDMMVAGAIRTAHFLNSKLPGPIYNSGPLQSSQLTAIAPAQQARFLRYFEAANDPNVVFRELRSGIAPAPEHIETLRTCYPQLYQRAQQVVLEAVHSDQGGKTIPYQSRLALAELFDVPGQIEPTLDPGFMSRLAQTAKQGAHEEAQKNAPQPGRKMTKDVSDSMQSPLNQLHI